MQRNPFPWDSPVSFTVLYSFYHCLLRIVLILALSVSVSPTAAFLVSYAQPLFIFLLECLFPLL